MSNWKNKTCPIFNCEDRLEQSKLREELEREKEEKNKLYNEMEQIKSLVSEGAISIERVIEEVLKNKDIKSLDKDKLREILNAAFDEHKVSEIINQNLNQKKEISQIKRDMERTTFQFEIKSKEMYQLNETLKNMERKDIEEIKELNNIDVNLQNKRLELKKDTLELERVKKEITAFNEFKSMSKDEIERLKAEHQSLLSQLSKLWEELKFLLKFKKNAGTWNTKRYIRLIKKYLKFKDIKPTKADVIKLKLIALYDRMEHYEKVLVAEEWQLTQ